MAAAAPPAAISSVSVRGGPSPQFPKQSPQYLLRRTYSAPSASSSSALNQQLKVAFPFLRHRRRGTHNVTAIFASVSSSSKPKEFEQMEQTSPVDLLDSILSKVKKSDRGVLLTSDEHKKVAEVAEELHKFCVEKPVKCPLIFGEWDVVYCSVPTSPGGGYRSALGRLIFKTNDMLQVIEAPDTVRNKVSFSAFGFLDGEVSLEGKLKALDDKWIEVIFKPPELKVGPLDFKYGGQSEVKLEITYVDENIRLGKGSRGSLFVFQRR